MTDKLPPNLLALFAARPALRYLPPSDHALGERRTTQVTGVAAYLDELKTEPVPYHPTESWLEAKERKKLEKMERQRKLVNEDAQKLYKPSEDPNIRGDAYRTLFVGRLSYDTIAEDLEKEFSRYGRVERAVVVTDRGKAAEENGKVAKRKTKSRGYGFIVFETEAEFKRAYDMTSNNFSIKGRAVVVDAERGRTMPGWRPRRFGGGKGGRGYTKAPVPRAYGYGPPSGPGHFRGRGGFRGGFDRGGRGSFRGGGYRDGFSGGSRYNGGPDGAPSGPRGSYGGGGGYRGGGAGGQRSFGPDSRGGATNANSEPLAPRRPRDPRDRDRDRDRDYDRERDRDRDRDRYRDRDSEVSGGTKRPYDGGGYEESRTRRRY